MIFNVILGIVGFLLNGVASLLPAITIFPTNLQVSLAGFMGQINGWSWLFPVSTIVQIFGLLVILVLAEFTYFVAMYILSLIHATVRG